MSEQLPQYAIVLKGELKKRNLNMVDVARQSGIGRSTIEELCRGSVKNLDKINIITRKKLWETYSLKIFYSPYFEPIDKGKDSPAIQLMKYIVENYKGSIDQFSKAGKLHNGTIRSFINGSHTSMRSRIQERVYEVTKLECFNDLRLTEISKPQIKEETMQGEKTADDLNRNFSNQQINKNRKRGRRLNKKQIENYKLLLKEATNNGIQIELPESGTYEKRRLLKKYFPKRFGEGMYDYVDKMQPFNVGIYFRDAIAYPEDYFGNIQYRTDKDKYKSEIENIMIDKEGKSSDLESLVQLEGNIRKKVISMSNEELKEEYERITKGTNSYLESLKRKGRDIEIRGLNLKIDSIKFYGAYTSALNTYEFTKEALKKGTPKQLKVKVNKDKVSRNYTMKDTKDVFLDALRRVAILEEYSKRIKNKIE